MDSIPNLDLGVHNMVGHIMDPFNIFMYAVIISVGLIIMFWTMRK